MQAPEGKQKINPPRRFPGSQTLAPRRDHDRGKASAGPRMHIQSGGGRAEMAVAPPSRETPTVASAMRPREAGSGEGRRMMNRVGALGRRPGERHGRPGSVGC